MQQFGQCVEMNPGQQNEMQGMSLLQELGSGLSRRLSHELGSGLESGLIHDLGRRLGHELSHGLNTLKFHVLITL